MNKGETLPPQGPVGVFDSGVGGLSVIKEIWEELPDEDIFYIGDQAHVPYGSRDVEQIRQFSEGITRYLLEHGAKLIVVACNTAAAAALETLRSIFYGVSFVGMEPAVKPAAERTNTGIVGVLATPATFQGDLYASVVERFASGVKILDNTCPGLVSQIEKGQLDNNKTRAILEEALYPMLSKGIDTVVLGCTHYPFVIPTIEEIAGPGVRVINPAPAVARQVRRLLDDKGLRKPDRDLDGRPVSANAFQNNTRIQTSGDPVRLEAILPTLLGENISVSPITWQENRLHSLI